MVILTTAFCIPGVTIHSRYSQNTVQYTPFLYMMKNKESGADTENPFQQHYVACNSCSTTWFRIRLTITTFLYP